MTYLFALVLATAALIGTVHTNQVPAQTPTGSPSAVVRSELIFESAPFPSVHASTIAETPDGIVAAWFGGSREGAPDVGIWVSRLVENRWTTPVEVATGVQENGGRLPCWNPVLFRMADGRLTLFYKVGPNPREWWGMVRTSDDHGRTWSSATRLPEGVLGPIKNKPVRLADGSILSPSSTESTDKPSLWRIQFERSTDGGRSWTITRPAIVEGAPELHSIQPSILIHGHDRLQAVGRSRAGRIFQTWSTDGGKSWGPVSLIALPNPSSGTDALTLRDGRHVIVYNHTPKGRTPLNIAVSKDGERWEAALTLESEPGEYSYPAVIQAEDGLLHVTYTWKRERIKHVVIDPARFAPVPITDGVWPSGVR